MDISSNKLLPLLGSLMVALTVGIGIKSCGKDREQTAALSGAAKTPPVDADSPADTLRALTAQVADMRLEAERLRKSNDAAMLQKNALSAEISNQVKQDLRKENLDQRDSALASILQRVEDMSAKIEAGSHPSNDALPLGTGLESDLGLTAKPDSIRIEPLNAQGLLDKLGMTVNGLKNKTADTLISTEGSLLHGLGDNAVVKSHMPGTGGNPGSAPANLPEPVYTVPRNATLIGSTGMTALIGRIPIKGNVDDPYPFKVIVGSDNLAANGLEIPGVDGMIFTGTALGDWSLACVRGSIYSVTFVFEDGTIRTLSSDDQSLQQKSRESALAAGQTNSQPSGGQSNSSPGGNHNGQQALGWLSDRRGIPCISGTRISNATQFLGGRFLARAIGAAGNAYARSQTTITTSPLTGGATSSVTGDPTQYALGSLASGSSDELAQWISERQAQNYDAVFVDTGAEVALHIDRELPIDFEPHGRKLAYARKQRGKAHYVAALD